METTPQEPRAAESTAAAQLLIIAQLRRELSDLMRIESHKVVKSPDEVIAFQVQLNDDVEAVFETLTQRFTAHGYTALIQERPGGGHEVIAVKTVVQNRPGDAKFNILLLLATVVSVLYIGATYGLSDAGFEIGQISPAEALVLPLKYLYLGLPFAATLLGILLTHELSHYFVARRYGSPVSLPYFIPMPLPPLGTMGAVIVQRAPMRSRKAIFDIGIAGPLGGLLVAIPLLLVGLKLSSVGPPPANIDSAVQEGNSLLYLGLKYLIFGRILPSNGEDVWLHSVAFAAWAGLLVTMLNLIPVGQLDGGHISYALLGRHAHVLGRVVIGALAAWGGWLLINGNGAGGIWLIWGLFNLMMNQRHPPPLNDVTHLDRRRVALGLMMVVIFVLIFIPMPLQEIQIR